MTGSQQIAMSLAESKVLESAVVGAGSLGVTAVRFYIFRMNANAVYHAGWSRNLDDEPKYVGRYAVEDNALRDTVVQVRAFFKDQGLTDVKIKRPQPVKGEVPPAVVEAAQR